ncbi:MAG: PEP-CTERM sorting domain-containing protein [Fimbriimonadaceae bacterium]
MKRCLFVVAAIACLSSAQAVILIDDFSSGAIDVVLTPPTNIVQVNRTGSMVGGSAFHDFGYVANAFGNSARMKVNTSIPAMDVSGEFQVETLLGLFYGVDSTGQFNASDDLNLNLTGTDRFRMSVFHTDSIMNIAITLYDAETVYGPVQSFATLGPGYNQNADFLFSSFGAFDFSDVDVIEIGIDVDPSADYQVRQIAAVPEPATMSALGLGIAGLLTKRKRK